MTHTLHRTGSPESLCQDYVLLILPARGINLEGAEETMRRMWAAIARQADHLVNFGNLTKGNRYRTSLPELQQADSRISHAVFRDLDSLLACLKEFKDQDFGISVTVSGLHEKIAPGLEKIGLKPHTVNLSLGVHGRVDKLPAGPVLEIATMCGHALVSRHLVEDVVRKVKSGVMSPAEGAERLSRLCECGIFNPERAGVLLKKMAGLEWAG